MSMELQLSTAKASQNLDKFEATLARVQAALNSFSTAQFTAAINAAANFKGLNASATASVKGMQNAMQGAGQAAAAAAGQFNNAGNAGNALVRNYRNAQNAAQAATGSFKGLGTALQLVSFAGITAGLKAFVSDAVDAANKIQTFKNVIGSITGSTEQAGKELDFLRGIAQKNGASMEALVGSYGNFRAAAANVGFTVDQTQEVFENMSGVFRVLNLSTAEQGLAFLALQQMMAKGVVSMEELRRQLGERMPTAFDTMARAVGVTQGELFKLIASGTVSSDVLLKFSQIAAQDFAGGLAEASQTGQAAIQRLQNAWFEFSAQFGQGFIEGIKPGIEFLTNWFTDGGVIAGAKQWGEAMGAAFGAVLHAIPAVITVMKNLGAVIAFLAGSQLVSMAVAIGKIVIGMNPWVKAITAVLVVAGLLKSAWEGITGLFGASTAATQDNTVATLSNRDAMIALNAANADAIQKENDRVEALRAANVDLQYALGLKEKEKALIDQAIEQMGKMSEAEKAAKGITEEVTKLAERKSAALGKDVEATQQKIALNQKEIDASGASVEALNKEVAATDQLIVADDTLNQVIGGLTATTGNQVTASGVAAGATQGYADAANNAATASDALQSILDGIISIWDDVTDAIGDAIDAVNEFFSSGGAEATAAGGAAGGDGGGDTVGGFLYGGLTNSSARSSYRVSKAAFVGAPAFAGGTPNTSGGFPAILHDNEAVIPLPDGRTVPVSMTGGGSSDAVYLIEIQDDTRKMRIATETMVETMKETHQQLRGDLAQVNIRLDRAYDVAYDTFRQTDKFIDFMIDAAKSKASGGGGGGGGGGSSGGSSGGGGSGVSSGGTGGGVTGVGGNASENTLALLKDGNPANDPDEYAWEGQTWRKLTQQEMFELSNNFLPDGWSKVIDSMGVSSGGLNAHYKIFDPYGNPWPGGPQAPFGSNYIRSGSFATGSPNAFDDIMKGGAHAIVHPDEAVIPLPDGRSVPVDFGSALDAQIADLRDDIKRVRGGGAGSVTINMTVNTPDADSFRRSSDQIAQDLRTRLDKATRQLGVRNNRDDPTRRV